MHRLRAVRGGGGCGERDDGTRGSGGVIDNRGLTPQLVCLEMSLWEAKVAGCTLRKINAVRRINGGGVDEGTGQAR